MDTTITMHYLGLRPFLLVELDVNDGDGIEGNLTLGGTYGDPAVAREVLRQAKRGIRQARKTLRAQVRASKKAAKEADANG